MKLALLPLLALTACVGLPTVLRPGYAEFDLEDGNETYRSLTLETDIPLSYPWQDQRPQESPQARREREILLERAWGASETKAQQAAVQAPWWEDVFAIQSLLLLLVGGAAVEARHPAKRWMQARKGGKEECDPS